MRTVLAMLHEVLLALSGFTGDVFVEDETGFHVYLINFTRTTFGPASNLNVNYDVCLYTGFFRVSLSAQQ